MLWIAVLELKKSKDAEACKLNITKMITDTDYTIIKEKLQQIEKLTDDEITTNVVGPQDYNKVFDYVDKLKPSI